MYMCVYPYVCMNVCSHVHMYVHVYVYSVGILALFFKKKYLMEI